MDWTLNLKTPPQASQGRGRPKKAAETAASGSEEDGGEKAEESGEGDEWGVQDKQ